jgi:high-affinity iron transporter
MVPPMLIMVREGFEAALIVALVFAYLRRIGRLDMAKATWLGIAAAVVLSAAVGVVIHLTVGSLDGEARLRAFAAISIVAAGVLTWMVFWMRRQARAIKGELEHRVDRALGASNATTAVAVVAFFAVLREGIEAALFLVAAATDEDGGRVVLGAAVGIAIAIALGLLVYLGGRRLPMRLFFQVTGVIVIVFAAGLLARTVLFLQSAGDLGSVDMAVYDLTRYEWLTQSSEVGRFLAAMLGWDPRPSFEQVLVWAVYLVPVTYLFLRTGARDAEAAEEIEDEVAASAPHEVADDRGHTLVR